MYIHGEELNTTNRDHPEKIQKEFKGPLISQYYLRVVFIVPEISPKS